jgi:hypothetical protein
LRLGYTRLDRWVFTQRLAKNAYVAGSGDPAAGEPFLGSPLGPDADRLQAEVAWSPDARWTLWLRETHTRRGDGNRDLTPWKSGTPYRLRFPSGVVRREDGSEIEVRARLDRFSELRAGAALERTPEGRQARFAVQVRLDL